MDYFKDNPIIVCKCGRKFRGKGTDRSGNERVFIQCMACTIEDFNKKKFNTK